MAIDPSISLNIRPVEPIDITKLQQIRNLAAQEEATRQSILSNQAQEALAREALRGTVPLQQELLRQQIPQTQAATALTQAQIPGVQAESEIQARRVKFNNWVTENSPKYVDPKTGVVDRIRLSNAATKEGFPAEADAIAASHITNLINLGNINKATNDSINYVANGLSSLKDPAQRASYLQTRADYMEKQIPGSGQYMLNLLGNVDAKTNTVAPDMNRVDAILKSTMTPLEAANLSIAQRQIAVAEESLRQAGITSISGPEARDPNSRMSVALRNLATSLGIPNVTPNMPAAEIANLPGFKQAVPAGIVPAEAKVGAIVGSQKEAQNAVRLDNTAELVDKLKKRGLLTGTTKVGTWVANQVSKLGNDPDYRALVAELEEIQRNNPSVDSNVGADALAAQLRGLSKTAKDVSKEAAKTAGAVTFPQIPQPAAKTAEPPSTTNIRLVDRQGKIYNVPSNLAEQYLNDPALRSMGLKRAEK